MNLEYNENVYLVCYSDLIGNHVYSYYWSRDDAVKVANEQNDIKQIRNINRFFFVEPFPKFIVIDLLNEREVQKNANFRNQCKIWRVRG